MVNFEWFFFVVVPVSLLVLPLPACFECRRKHETMSSGRPKPISVVGKERLFLCGHFLQISASLRGLNIFKNCQPGNIVAIPFDIDLIFDYPFLYLLFFVCG